MTIIFKRTTAVVIFLAIYGAFASRARGQQTSAAGTQPVAVIDYAGDMATLLAQLPKSFGGTIGFEVDPRKAKSYVKFYLQEPTLPQVVNAIVQSAGNYHWRESAGFIEVWPLEGSSRLLDTMISNLRINDVDEPEAINQLMNLPEVQAGMIALRLHRRNLSSASTETKSKRFSLSLETGTMRQALNRIAREGSSRFWIFQTYSDGSFSISNSPS